MGGTSTTPEDLRDRSAYRAASGTSFAYTATMASTPTHLREIHESVDPMRVNTLGWKGRECLDSDAHPLTIPVFVGFDETASMDDAPRILQTKLSTLYGALLKVGLDDAQLCFGAYGDAHNGEVAPCQVGQFESGLEMEDWLNNLYLEAMGGGNGGETSGLLLYFLAEHTRLDSLDKRGKKGYLILIGDERPHTTITRKEVEKHIGDNLEADLSIEEVVAKAQEKYEVFMFLVNNSTARSQGSLAVWQKLLGKDNVIVTEGLDNISEQVAMTVAVLEGVLDDVDDAVSLLTDAGASLDAARKAGSAIEPLIGNVGVVPTGTGTLPIPTDKVGAGAERL